MKKIIKLIVMLMAVMQISAGQQQDPRESGAPKSGIGRLSKTTGTLDRAAGIHNRGNVGMYFENRGKLYPRRTADGPNGEFPLGSKHDHIYKANPFVGIPGNVIQSKLTTNEEWEAVGGYHNPVQPGAAYLSVAMSDNPNSWPASGWPVKDSLGNPIIISDQDSYCVYSDSGSATPIGLLMKQTAYCWGVKPVQNIIWYKFEIVNISGRRLDSLYFSIYSEISIGNASGGDPEYLDDKIVFNKAVSMYYKYDVDHKSTDWGMNPMDNEFGCMLIKTPKVNGVELGMTDWHYMYYDDDNNLDADSIIYGVMSSDPRTKSDPYWGPRLFHTGTSSNIHFDDSLNIPTTDDVCYQSSGPYTLQPGETLGPFIVAFVAGINHTEFMQYAMQAKSIMDKNWAVPSAPPPPTITVIGRDQTIQVSWDNKSEIVSDRLTGNFDFEGYKLYRSSDYGSTWTMLAQYDKVNDLPPNNGIQYTYEDRDVINDFYYWYSITAYDRGDSLVERLESAIGSNPNLPNLKIGRAHLDISVPATTTDWIHIGNSNYIVEVFLKDQPPNGIRQDSIRFMPCQRVIRGNLKTKVTLQKTTPTDTVNANVYSVRFYEQPAGVLRFQVRDTTTKLIVRTANYKADSVYVITIVPAKGTSIVFSERDTIADFKAQAGDSLIISPGVFVTADQDTVLPLQPLLYNTTMLSTNGLLFRFSAPSPFVSQQLVTGNGLNVTTSAQHADSAVSTLYRISVLKKYSNGMIKLQLIDTSFSTTVPVAVFDSLAGGTLAQWSNRGLTFKASFSASNVPDSTAVYEIVTRKLIRHSYSDLYSFRLIGGSVYCNQELSTLGKFTFFPNYPNPFNASTILRYVLQVPGKVRLTIYDILGRQLAILVDKDQEAGLHEIRWDASQLSSGIYMCRLEEQQARTVSNIISTQSVIRQIVLIK